MVADRGVAVTRTTPPPGLGFVDLSSHQAPGRVDWAAMRSSGVRHVYLRAVEGKDPDAAYKAHRYSARQAGLLVGAYTFWRPRHSFALLVDCFLDFAGARAGADWDLPPVVDLESEDATDQLAPDALEHHVNSGMVELRLRTGVDPLLYVGPNYVETHLPAAHQLGRWGLWCAAYTDRLLLPRGWSSAVAWQWTGSGSVPGYPGPADRSVWMIDEDEIAAMVADVRSPS